MRILSIDPGFERLGIAIIDVNDKKEESLLFSSCFTTSPKDPFYFRLFCIGKEIKRIIKKYTPDILAIETLFFNTNQKTAMQVAEARGIIIYEAYQASISVFEYTPLQIKIAITSYGRASKEQMMEMIKKLITVGPKKRLDDEYDAIAIGLTHSAYKRHIF